MRQSASSTACASVRWRRRPSLRVEAPAGGSLSNPRGWDLNHPIVPAITTIDRYILVFRVRRDKLHDLAIAIAPDRFLPLGTLPGRISSALYHGYMVFTLMTIL